MTSPRIESVVSPPVRGAGRSFDISYPSPQLENNGNLAQGLEWINRQGISIFGQGTVTGFGIPPAGSGWTTYRGRFAHRQTGSGTSGGFYKTGSNFDMYFPQTRASIGGNFNDDFRCWRVLGILAFDGSALGAGDIGIEVSPPANYDMIVGLTPGYRVAPTAAGAISFQVRQTSGAAFTVNQVVANVDVNDWHAYELRFIGATATADGVCKCFIDGILKASFNYGVGTLLPSWANGGAIGYQLSNGNRGAASVYICKNGLQVAASATEQGLL